MFIASILRPRTIAAVALALVIGSSAYGFAAANTLEDTGVGDSTEAISGYAVTDVVYTVDSDAPSNIDQVVFSITPIVTDFPDPTSVKVSLRTADAPTTCVLSGTAGAKVATCAITGVTTESATNLRVIARSDA